MPTYGRTAHDASYDAITAGGDSTHASITMLRAFTITDAPISILKITIYGQTFLSSNNGFLKGVICNATDNGDGTFSVTNVLGTTSGITIAGSSGLQEWDMVFASSLNINSNKTCAMGILAYNDLSSQGMFAAYLDSSGGGYNIAVTGEIYDYDNPPTNLSGLSSNQFNIFDHDIYVTYSVKIPLGVFDPELVPVAIF